MATFASQTQQDTYTDYGGNNGKYEWAQSFKTPANASKITSVTIRARADVGSDKKNCTLYISIRSDSPTGTEIGSGSNNRGYTCVVSEFNHTVSGLNIPVSPNTTYYLLVNYGYGGGVDEMKLALKSGNQYSDGQYYSESDGVWTPDSDKDLYFSIDGDILLNTNFLSMFD